MCWSMTAWNSIECSRDARARRRAGRARPPVERLVELPVHRDGPEWRVVGLEGDREGILHARVAGAQDRRRDRRPSARGARGRPRRRSSPPRWKSICGAIGARRSLPRSRRRHAAPRNRAIGVDEEAVDLRLQRRRVSRVGAARMRRRARTGVCEKASSSARRRCRKPVAVEEPGVIEPLGDRAICFEGGRLAVPALRISRISLDRMLAIEERDQVRGRNGSTAICSVKPAGSRRATQRCAFLLDREGLEGPQARVSRQCGHSASR